MSHEGRIRRTSGPAALAAALVLLATGATTSGAVRTAEAATALPRTTLTATVRDLGTLGGAGSEAKDIDGNMVVGDSFTAAGQEHAFAYDLTTSEMRDLGTLGGPSSTAVAVDGNIVAGSALTSDLKWHAFAYDLATSTMHDVGSLVPGGTSEARDVDGGVVVGQSGATVGQGHAFAYDVGSATLRDLGDLGLGQSAAKAVDARTVVGTAWSQTTDERQPFAYDLATSTMRKIAPLLRDEGNAVDVSGPVVVGASFPPSDSNEDNESIAYAFDLTTSTRRDLPGLDPQRPFVSAVDGHDAAGHAWTLSSNRQHAASWDLSATAPAIRDHGTLGGRSLSVAAVHDGVVVGRAGRSVDDRERPFAVDLRAKRPRLTDLGTLGGYSGAAAAVAGRTVVGWSSTASSAEHATAWTLRTTSAPSFRFATLRTGVQEDVGTARVTVVREGSTGMAVSVRYAVRDPRSGGDVRQVSGTIRFAPGQVRRTIPVPVVDDRRMERDEEFLVVLRSPSSGAVLGTPQAASLVMRASDQRPDAAVATGLRAPWAGIGIRNTTGAGQTRTVTVRRGAAHDFSVSVNNAGNAPGWFVVRGSAARPGSTVRYFDGIRDVTRQVRSRTGLRERLVPTTGPDLTVRIRVSSSAAVGSLKPATVTATWQGDGTRTDLVRAVARVAR